MARKGEEQNRSVEPRKEQQESLKTRRDLLHK